jgi:hypothetical protein
MNHLIILFVASNSSNFPGHPQQQAQTWTDFGVRYFVNTLFQRRLFNNGSLAPFNNPNTLWVNKGAILAV